MSVSADHSLLAIYTVENRILVLTTDLNRVICNLSTGSTQGIREVCWCGNDAVGLVTDDAPGDLWLFGPVEEPLIFSFDPSSIFLTETDGLRIISLFKNEIITKVPQSLVDALSIGSTHPAALLVEGYSLFQRKDFRSEVILNSIREESIVAIETCIDASYYDDYGDGSLLEATTLGLEYFGVDFYERLDQAKRIKHTMKQLYVSTPMTFKQFFSLGIERVVDLLLVRELTEEALNICKRHGHDPYRVLTHQAILQVQSKRPESEIVKGIVNLFKENSKEPIPSIKIARAAFRANQPKLATKVTL